MRAKLKPRRPGKRCRHYSRAQAGEELFWTSTAGTSGAPRLSGFYLPGSSSSSSQLVTLCCRGAAFNVMFDTPCVVQLSSFQAHLNCCAFCCCVALLLQLQLPAALGPNWHSKAQYMIGTCTAASGSQRSTKATAKQQAAAATAQRKSLWELHRQMQEQLL